MWKGRDVDISGLLALMMVTTMASLKIPWTGLLLLICFQAHLPAALTTPEEAYLGGKCISFGQCIHDEETRLGAVTKPCIPPSHRCCCFTACHAPNPAYHKAHNDDETRQATASIRWEPEAAERRLSNERHTRNPRTRGPRSSVSFHF